MRLGRVVALFADVHGADLTLQRALEICRAEGVETVALLGDLYDRLDQADAVVRPLLGWHVVGVYGNHEEEAARVTSARASLLRPETRAVLAQFRDRVVCERAEFCLQHEEAGWGRQDPLATLFGTGQPTNGRRYPARVTFHGHTHYRQARDDRGPLEIARGLVTLDPARRYLINPGALLNGEFAIWDRDAAVVRFHQVEHALRAGIWS